MSDVTPPQEVVHNVLIGCTGSVASIKIPELVARFRSSISPKFRVKVMTTQHATHFFSTDDLPADVPVLNDDDEWSTWSGRGDPVLHIELNRWADVLVLAPLDANSMAKIANVSKPIYKSTHSLKTLKIYSFHHRESAIIYFCVPFEPGQ